MKLQAKTIYELSKVGLDMAKLIFISLVVTPFVNGVTIPSHVYLYLGFGLSIMILISVNGINWYHRMQDKDGLSSNVRKHRIRFPKNTTLNIEVEKD